MTIGNHITLVRSVPNIPWYNALGILQNLNPAILQSMANTPANQWAEKGLLLPFKVKQITKHNVGARPLATVGFTNWTAQGITVDSSNNINRQGAVINGAQYATAQANVVGTVQALGCFYQSVFWTVNIYMDDTTHELFVGMSRDYANPWTDLTIRQLRVDTGAEANLSFNNANKEPNSGTRTVGGSSVGTTFQPVDIFYGGILFSACSFDFELSCKLFKNYNGLKEYQTTGNTESEIGGEPTPEIPAVDRQTTLYLKCDVMQRSNDPTAAPEKIKSVSIEFVVQYKTNSGEAIGTGNPRTGVVGIVTNTLDSQLFNIWYKQPNDTAKRCKVYKMYVDTGNGRHEVDPKTWTFTSADRLGIYKTEVYKDNNIFYGNIRTNMLIFANEAAAEGYINKDYDPTTGKLPAPILDGDRTYSPDLPTGDKLTYNGIQTMPTGGLSECWLLDAAGLEQLASIFKTGLTIEENEEFGFFETTLLSTVRGLSMYNSPIDMIVDMFWIPIDISDYCNLGSETQFTVNGEEYAGEYGLSSAYSWVKQRQGDALDMTGRIGNAIGESFAVKTQQEPTNE